jgi:sarcosine oxidase delta subunit
VADRVNNYYYYDYYYTRMVSRGTTREPFDHAQTCTRRDAYEKACSRSANVSGGNARAVFKGRTTL